jgi:MFS family permease
MYSFSVFFVALLKEYGWKRSLTAGAFSVFWILHGLIGPFVGGMVDRFGSRRVFVLGSLLLGAGLALCSSIHSWWQFYLYFSFIASMGVASTGWVPNATVIQNWFREKRGLAMGIISSGVGTGIFICIPSIQLLINRLGWRMTYSVMALFIPLSIVSMAALFLKRRPPTLDEPPKRENVPAPARGTEAVAGEEGLRDWTLRQAIFTRPFATLGICFMFSGSITQSILAHHMAFFVDEGLDALSASYIVGLTGIVSIAGKIFWGTLSDRIGREVTYSLVISCATCGLLSLISFASRPFPVLPYLYAVFFGLGYAGIASLAPLITADFFAGRAYGKIFGTLYALNGIGGAFGVWFAGFLYDQVRSYVPFFMIMIACGLFVCLIVWIAAPRTVRRRGRPENSRVLWKQD